MAVTSSVPCVCVHTEGKVVGTKVAAYYMLRIGFVLLY